MSEGTDINKRILPYSIDAERCVLGAVMLNKRALIDEKVDT